jgi:ABC-type nitrate/sulfonate/bicarbonate transport system substrate-binding protein
MAMLRRFTVLLRLAALCLALANTTAYAREAVTLQLKWTHAFQFAGYYAAQELGYYRDAGLDVRIDEAQPGVDPVMRVLDGTAQFGVGNSNLLLARRAGQPVVALAVIFQHSPLVLIARQTHATQGIHDLVGKRLMIEPQSDELLAYLKQEGIPLDRTIQIEHSFDPHDLIDGKVDAISAYVTNEPYYLDRAHLAYQTYTPRAAGIDFYGDNLFTTERELAQNPRRVEAFRTASLRGWQYAMAHPAEIADLIGKKYPGRHPRDFYLYEAQRMAQLMQTELIEVGYMNPGRWRHIAETYADLGLLPHDFPLDGFLYEPNPHRDLAWLYRILAAALFAVAVIGSISLYIHRINLRLGKALDKLERENEFACDVMQRLVRLRTEDPRVAQWSRPALTFSGDVTAATRTPDGRLWALLADCTGHGLSAALNVVPVVEMFYGMAARGLPLEEACAALNRHIHSLMPTGRFVCAALAEIDPETQSIRLWNGGMPPVLCTDASGEIVYRGVSRHLALGIADAELFDAAAETFALPRGGILLMCSDGLLEAAGADGHAFGDAELAGALRQLARGTSLPELARCDIERKLAQAHDDVTILTITLDF